MRSTPSRVAAAAAIALPCALGTAGVDEYTFMTQSRFTNMSVFLFTGAVIIFMLGLVSEQIALLRMERQSSLPPSGADGEGE